MTSSLPPESPDASQAARLVERLRPLGRNGARRVLRTALASFSTVERAALAARWEFWGRGKQLPPAGDWITWGFLAGRGFGKTLAVSHFVNAEVEAGRATLIGLAAQDEANCVALQVNGPSGLITTAKPRLRPTLHGSSEGPVLHWPNGARAYVRTPEVPGKIRGLEYHLSWICELQSWPNATRQESFDNFFLSTRLGYGRIVWDSTAKRRIPLLKELLARNEADPTRHVIVRGSMYENRANLAASYAAEMERKFKGTQREKEELLGQIPDDADGALFKQDWIDAKRVAAVPKIVRRVISVDPAVTNRKGSDTTGIVDVALGADGRGYVLGDYSGKMDPGAWVKVVIDRYLKGGCDVVIAETNKGGSLVATTLRAVAALDHIEVIVLGKDERAPVPMPGKIFVREVYARGDKADRAEPVATAYQRGRVSHVGSDLVSLEDTLTTWEASPNADSPGDLDALVHATVDLLDLTKNVPDPAEAFKGIDVLAKELAAPAANPVSLAHVLSREFGAGRGDRI
jgi:phage terminase large subunit-like protein